MIPSCNIFLVGLMGSGKTTIGKILSRQRDLEFYDSDHEIVARCGVSIPTIFEIEGEEGFRRREICVIDDLSQREGIVLATGGGAILHDRELTYSLALPLAHPYAPPELEPVSCRMRSVSSTTTCASSSTRLAA